jgi:hypothetical protein
MSARTPYTLHPSLYTLGQEAFSLSKSCKAHARLLRHIEGKLSGIEPKLNAVINKRTIDWTDDVGPYPHGVQLGNEKVVQVLTIRSPRGRIRRSLPIFFRVT